MKETKDTKEFENTIEDVNNLTHEDAKALLELIYGFINTAVTGNGGDKVKLEIIDEISDIYKRIPELRKSKSSEKGE